MNASEDDFPPFQDPRDWRQGVAVSLTEIRMQVGRLVSDRESEKGTIQRIISQSREDHRELTKNLEEHRKEDTENFSEITERVSKSDRKIMMIVGIGIGLQTLATIVLALLGILKGVRL